MRDHLEDFIGKNRDAFDDQEPAQHVWNKIDNELFMGQKERPWYNSLTLWRAAAIIFMVLSVYLLLPKTQTTDARISQETERALRDFTDVESFYIKQISEKVELIDDFEKSEGLNGFTKDFQQLEAMYNVLKEEMKVRPSQKVKDALVLNLLVQIDLLNQHLHKLEKEAQPHSDKVKSEASI